MQTLFLCIGMVLVHLLLFELFGAVAAALLRLDAGPGKNLIVGFFVYFSLLQLAGLPMVFTKQSLTALSFVWMAVLLVMAALFALCFWKHRERMGLKTGPVKKAWNGYTAVMVLCAFMVCYFVVRQNYYGWDTAFYIGNINTSLYTDTMYQFDGSSGLPRTSIDLRYALSMFYMNSALFCKWTGIAAADMQKIVIALLCVILHSVLVWEIGKKLFLGEVKKTAAFTSAALLLNFFFVSEYTTSQFLLLRAYEAKAYCGSVVIPAIFYGLVRIWKEDKSQEDREDKKEIFRFLFLVMFASVPVSMSCILLAPALLVIGLLAEFLMSRRVQYLKYGLLCVIPNVIYLLVYFLYSRGILIIKV